MSTNAAHALNATDLAREGREIKELHLSLERTSLERAIQIGRKLIMVKESLPHGQFMKWVEANCGFGRAQASRYMNSAKLLSESNLPSTRPKPDLKVVHSAGTEQPAQPTTIRAAAALGAKKQKPKTYPWLAAAERCLANGLPVGFPRDKVTRTGVRGTIRALVEKHLGRSLPDQHARLDDKCDEAKAIADALIAAYTEWAPEESGVAAKAAVADISKSAGALKESEKERFDKLVDKAVKARHTELEASFWAEVEKKVEEKLEKRELALAEKERLVSARLKRLDAWMTEEEFKVVLSCLHPDKQPQEIKARFERAFTIFSRLKEHMSLDKKALKTNGWTGR